MRRHVVLLFVMLSICYPQSASAQDGDRPMSRSIARELLASTDPKEQAWGAWMAGRLLMTDVTPQIERVIRAGLASQYLEGWARVSVGLDALIEIGAKPDPSLLTATRGTAPVQSLILLSRMDAAAAHVLLAIMADSMGYPWFAAANLLKQRRAAGFAASLLKEVELVAEVVVSLDGKVGIEGGIFGAVVGDKAGGLAEGYPPLTDYAFRGCSGSNRAVLADGPTTVCYAKARRVLSSHDINGPTDEDRLAYFTTEWSPLQLQALQSVSVVWKDDAGTKAALAEVVSVVQRKYAAAIPRLQQLGWLTDDEARALATPRIRTSIRDLRPR